MKSFYITFRSVTFAQRGEQVLGKHGIRCSLQRTPKWMEEQGCGYCLRVWTHDPGQAAAILRREQVPYRKIYAQMENGTMEERSL